MKQFSLLIIFMCFLRAHAQDFDTDDVSKLDCSKFANDSEVLAALPFKTLVDPPDTCFNQTCALTYRNNSVFQMEIAYQKFIPPTLFCLQSVQSIRIIFSSFCKNQDENSICQLPSEIDHVADSLESLYIYATKVNYLPASFGKLKRLRNIDFGLNGLMDLPNTFGDLTSLTDVYISSNRFTSLPKVLGKVQPLTNLNLVNNKYLRSIQSLNGHRNLSNIRISNCPITRIPLNLPSLCLLSMDNTSLTNLNGIETLGTGRKWTQVFGFDGSKISRVPAQIATIKDLGGLSLKNNTLTNLPEELFNTTTLNFLDIRDNRFSANRLKEIVAKFKAVRPTLLLLY